MKLKTFDTFLNESTSTTDQVVDKTLKDLVAKNDGTVTGKWKISPVDILISYIKNILTPEDQKTLQTQLQLKESSDKE